MPVLRGRWITFLCVRRPSALLGGRLREPIHWQMRTTAEKCRATRESPTASILPGPDYLKLRANSP
jgi:hypothetical protein